MVSIMYYRLLFFLIWVLIFWFVGQSLWPLLGLLGVFEDGGDPIKHAELPFRGSRQPNARPHVVPKIIHQVYIGESVPERWLYPQQTCIETHQDFEYMVIFKTSS